MVAWLAGTPAVRGASLGSAFTYQGELLDSGVAVDGMTEFQFTLWDDGVAGTQVAVLPSEMIDVVTGRFTAKIDFGATAFPGEARWLEISVKPPSATAFTVLSRQELTPSPSALAMPGVKTEETATETVLSIGTATPVRLMRDNATGDLKLSAGTSNMTLNSTDGLTCFGDGPCVPPVLAAEAGGLNASTSITSPMIFDPVNRVIQLTPTRAIKIDPVTDKVVVTGNLLSEGGVTAQGNVDAVAAVAPPLGAASASLITSGIRLSASTQTIEAIDTGTPVSVNPTGQTMLGTTTVSENFQAKKLATFGTNALEIDGDTATIRPTDPTATLFLDAGNVCLGSSCCVVNPAAMGCQEQTCETAVCAIIPTCCSVAWDQGCAAQAAISCPTLCAPKNMDVTGDSTVAGNTSIVGSGSFGGPLSIGSSGVAAGAGAAAEQLVGSITIDGETISSSTGQVDFTNDNLVNIQKVGIGTPNPSFALDARGTVFQLKTTGGFGPSLQLVGDNTGDTTIKLCNVPGSGCNSIFDDRLDAHTLKIAATNEFAVNIGGPTGEAFRIDSAKNVGIGTNAPLARMHVQEADLSVNSAALSLDDVVVESADAVLGLYSNASGAFGSTLVLAEVDGTGAIADKWAITRNDTGAGARLFFKYGPNAAYTANPTIMALEPGGNVGVGTTGPNSRLHVNGDGVSPSLRVQVNGSSKLTVAANGGTTIGAFNNTPPANGLFVSGAVGIGTSNPQAALHVEQGSQFVPMNVNRTGNGGFVIFTTSGLIQGSISVSGSTVSYNAFTGSHFAAIEGKLPSRGQLVRLTGRNRTLHPDDTSEIVYGVSATTAPNDPACLGSYLDRFDTGKEKTDANVHQIMAVGNGDMWVADTGRNIQPGDYLISSDVRGHAMLDDPRRFPVGYVVARVGEPVDWSKVTDTVDGVKHKKISVFFESFVRGSEAVAELQAKVNTQQASTERMQTMLESQQERIAKLESQSAELAKLKAQISKLAKVEMRLTDAKNARLASAGVSTGGVR